jgi:hypothetical protein
MADYEEDDAILSEEDNARNARDAAANKPAPKRNIVTKEELAKSGLSLRDYMNKQQGLTRRKDPAPKNEGMAMTRMDPEKAREIKRMGELEVLRDTALRRAEGERIVSAAKAKKKAEAEAAAAASLSGNKRGGVIKSSASSRGDGIATRGKTRGKLC